MNDDVGGSLRDPLWQFEVLSRDAQRSTTVVLRCASRLNKMSAQIALFVCLLLAVSLFFWRLGDRDLWSSHEGRAAMDASSLLQPDSDGLPRLHDGRRELQKPPLFYWIVAGLAWFRGGVDAWAVRLPSALSAIGVVAIVVLSLAVGLKRPLAGLVAGCVLATSIHFPWLARIGRIDMPLTLAVTIASFSFLFARQSARAWPLLLVGYLACAAGVLLKGPIGAALPAAIVAAHLLAEGEWPAIWECAAWRRLLGTFGVGWGVVVVLAVVVPLFVWIEQVSAGQFSQEFFWHHNVQRGLGGSRLRSHPWYLYPGYLLLYLLPYSPLLLAALCWRGWRTDAIARLGLAWLVGVLLLLSAAHFKRADYLLPAYPGAAIFLGCVVERWRAAWGLLAGLAGAMLVGWVVWLGWKLPAEEPFRDYRRFAAEIRRHAPMPAEVVVFRAETHALDFRMGRPIRRFVEWQQLREYLNRPGVHHLVMPPGLVEEARQRMPDVRLDELCRNTTLAGGRHERPLVLLRVCP